MVKTSSTSAGLAVNGDRCFKTPTTGCTTLLEWLTFNWLNFQIMVTAEEGTPIASHVSRRAVSTAASFASVRPPGKLIWPGWLTYWLRTVKTSSHWFFSFWRSRMSTLLACAEGEAGKGWVGAVLSTG